MSERSLAQNLGLSRCLANATSCVGGERSYAGRGGGCLTLQESDHSDGDTLYPLLELPLLPAPLGLLCGLLCGHGSRSPALMQRLWPLRGRGWQDMVRMMMFVPCWPV